MSRLGDEVAQSEPAAYNLQSKPRGRKPKKAKADSGASGSKPKSKKGKNRKGGRKNRKTRKMKAVKSAKAKRDAAKETPATEDSSGAFAVPEPKAKAAPKRRSKAKSKAKPSAASAAEPAVVAPEPVVAPSQPTTLPQGMTYPPEWVKSGNVYSNSYRRAVAAGKSLDETKEYAKDCTRRFRECGGVDLDLVDSFGLAKPSRKKKVTPDATGSNSGDADGANANKENGVVSK